MNSKEIIRELKSKANPKNVKGMARFGISEKGTLGIAIPELRKIAKSIGKNHKLAKELWKSGIHEARLLAAFIGEPGLITEKEMEEWVKDFDSWDICDQVCSNIFCRSKLAYKKVFDWSEDKREFVKRTSFALIACLAVHDKKAKDKDFLQFFPLIEKAAEDERNFVKKAVNWSLRQIGKRNLKLNKKAIQLAKDIRGSNDCKSAKWVANNALTELEGVVIQKRLKGE